MNENTVPKNTLLVHRTQSDDLSIQIEFKTPMNMPEDVKKKLDAIIGKRMCQSHTIILSEIWNTLIDELQ